MKKVKNVLVFVLLIAFCFSFAACDPQVGPAGADGKDGSSAYQIWLEQGHTGTQQDFLNWLKGSDGANGASGTSGADGLSAYDIWLEAGNQGTVEEFLEWLKGDQGNRGSRGPAGEKGDAGEDSPYGAMAVEVSTAREFLDALNPRLKKEIIVLKNDIDFTSVMAGGTDVDPTKPFTGTVSFEGINRTIIGRKVDVYKEGTNTKIDERNTVIHASILITKNSSSTGSNVKFYSVDIMPVTTTNANKETANSHTYEGKFYQAGMTVAEGSTLEMYQSRISMDHVEYTGDSAALLDLDCKDLAEGFNNVYVSYGLYIAATATSAYLEDVTIDNSDSDVGGKYGLWTSCKDVTIYRGSFFGRRYAIGIGLYLVGNTETVMSVGEVMNMFIVRLAEDDVGYETDLAAALAGKAPPELYYGKFVVMTGAAPNCYYTIEQLYENQHQTP